MSKQEYSEGEVSSLKDLLYNTIAGRIIVMGTIVTGLVLSYQAIDQYLPKQAHKPEEIVTKNVIGNWRKDTYIERDGIKYFSKIDGKDITNLIK